MKYRLTGWCVLAVLKVKVQAGSPGRFEKFLKVWPGFGPIYGLQVTTTGHPISPKVPTLCRNQRHAPPPTPTQDCKVPVL